MTFEKETLDELDPAWFKPLAADKLKDETAEQAEARNKKELQDLIEKMKAGETVKWPVAGGTAVGPTWIPATSGSAWVSTPGQIYYDTETNVGTFTYSNVNMTSMPFVTSTASPYRIVTSTNMGIQGNNDFVVNVPIEYTDGIDLEDKGEVE